ELDPFSVVGGFVAKNLLTRVRTSADPKRIFYEFQKLELRANALVEAIERIAGARPGARMQVDVKGTTPLEDTIRRAARALSLAIARDHTDDQYPQWGDFSVAQATGEKPVTRRLHVAFVAPSRENVDQFWRVGTEAGYRDDGAPGLRPQYSPEYYGSFLLDPDGNSAEAVYHEERRRGPIDHLWIRVADLDASRRFYDTLAPYTGFSFQSEGPD